MRVVYKGELRTECHHESGAVIETNAPKEVGGLGGSFSPTDLFAASVASCMLTMMGSAAKKIGIDLKGATSEVVKEMSDTPRRHVGKLILRFRLPFVVSPEAKAKIETAALQCPVHESISPQIKLEHDFVWGL